MIVFAQDISQTQNIQHLGLPSQSGSWLVEGQLVGIQSGVMAQGICLWNITRGQVAAPWLTDFG